jgi:hypothetical protein
MGIGSTITRAIIRGVIQGVQQVAHESAHVERFNQRRAQVGSAHALAIQDFAIPLLQGASDRMTPKEHQKIEELTKNANYRGEFLMDHVGEANDRHLNDYAIAIKRLAIVAMKLCQKYSVYSDIYSVTYDARRKMIMLNGKDQYCLM